MKSHWPLETAPRTCKWGDGEAQEASDTRTPTAQQQQHKSGLRYATSTPIGAPLVSAPPGLLVPLGAVVLRRCEGELEPAPVPSLNVSESLVHVPGDSHLPRSRDRSR